jgi:hypothetical protein
LSVAAAAANCSCSSSSLQRRGASVPMACTPQQTFQHMAASGQQAVVLLWQLLALLCCHPATVKE